ncbi:phage tail protein [Niallia sp. FSL W8-0951]|uniref:DUF7359 domain-containing protein n=1 Tax=Niallia sp. FSL W8-0951 TaxID=2954639 RepID=UPI0030F809DF
MLQYYVDYGKRPRKLRLFLMNPQGMVVGELEDSYSKKQTIRFNDRNDMSFIVPYIINMNGKLRRNPNIKKFNKRNFIRAVLYDVQSEQEIYREDYVVVSKIKSVNERVELVVNCKSREYELSWKKIIGYDVISYTCKQVTTDCLKGTGWTIGYINPEFNEKYRKFSVSSKTKLEFLVEIADTFKAILVFDTINCTVNFYKEEEVSKYKGFVISNENYLQSIEETLDEDDLITRLTLKGADDLTVVSVNPTGKSYIDDFSYYYDVMSEDLNEAMKAYNEKLKNNNSTLRDLLSKKKSKQESLTKESNKLTILNSELKIILDNIQWTKDTGGSLKELNKQRTQKETEIRNVKSSIKSIENDIKDIDAKITSVKVSLSYEGNFTERQLNELESYIHEGEWSDSNITDENDLMSEGRKYLEENNSPSIDISMNVVNFFEIVSEQHNWDRFGIGDIIRVEQDDIGTYVEVKILEYTIDYESDSLNVNVSNGKRIAITPEDQIALKFIEVDQMKADWSYTKSIINKTVTNFNTRNDRNSTMPVSPTFPIDSVTHRLNNNGSVNISVRWDYPNYDITGLNEHDIDGFEIFLYSSPLDETYTFGSTIAKEEKERVSYETRTISFTNKSPVDYHTLGIRAYREVDPDINKNRIIYSDMLNFPNMPYLPSETVVVNGFLNGKVNGTTFLTADKEPEIVEAKQTVFINPTTQEIKIADENGELKNVKSGSSSTLDDYYASVDKLPFTIPVRDEYGMIFADISGDAKTLDGFTPQRFAILDETGNVPTSNLGNTHKFTIGNYIGDGTNNKLIPLPFTPSLVEIYTTVDTDNSLFIPSVLGGFFMSTNNNLFLSSISNDLSLIYGQLTINGFYTGNDENMYGNKLNIKYYYKAYYIPPINEEAGEENEQLL